MHLKACLVQNCCDPNMITSYAQNAGGTRALLQRLLPLPWMSQPASTYKSCVQAAQHPKPTRRSKQHMPVHTHEQHFAAGHFAERRWKVLHAQAMLRFEVAPDEAFPSSFHSPTFLCGCNMTALQYCRHHIMYSDSSKRQGISSLAALLGRASGTDVHAGSALTEVQTSQGSATLGRNKAATFSAIRALYPFSTQRGQFKYMST